MLTEIQSAIQVRPAHALDDLTVLWPESADLRLNRDHVLVADEDGVLVGGAMLYHGGHSAAILGAVAIVPTERRRWVYRALVNGVREWCMAHDVQHLRHFAGTEACAEIMRGLGAEAVAPVEMMKFTLPRHEDHRIRLAFLSPFSPASRAELDRVIEATGGHHEMAWHPAWHFVATTLGAWEGARLVGYLQFGLGLYQTFLWGTRVLPSHRGQGLARRLMAGWLQLAYSMAARVAFGYEAAGNVAIAKLLTMAKFERHDNWNLYGMPAGGAMYVGGPPAFAWAGEEPSESWQ